MKTESLPHPNTPVTARQCAVELLAEVVERKRSFDEAVAHHPSLHTLQDRDRNFARLLTLTTLRRLGQIDAAVAQWLVQPLRGRTQVVQHCLRLGVAQILWLKTPAHAAVNETVATVEALGHGAMKGVVNAVLKRAVREGEALIATQDEAVLNVPSWLYESWKNAYGEAQARAIALTRLQEAPLDITVIANPESWADKLGGTVLPTGSLRLERAGRVDELAGFAEGQWWVQDAAAALPARLLGDVAGKTVLDLCAAPGGKTAQLAAAGAEVIAVDQSARRLEVLTSNMQRLRLSVRTVAADVVKWQCDKPVDAILLDAPCSATGTVRRHPELVWHRSPEDVARLAMIQRRLLNRAARWLAPEGRLVYCVCSLQPEEGREQIRHFLATHPQWELERVSGLPHEFIDENGAYRTHPALWPEWGGVDGFYSAILRQKKPD